MPTNAIPSPSVTGTLEATSAADTPCVPGSATQKLDADRLVFLVKWVASIIQIMGYAATGFGWTPWNLYLFLVGVVGWFAVGVLWNDKALMLVHLVALGAMVVGMTAG